MNTQILESQLIQLVSREIEEITGVQLGENQHKLVQSRLQMRRHTLKIESAQKYWQYLQENESKEIPILISSIVTHHTLFFREFPQFEYLAQVALPELIKDLRAQHRTHIKIWSAGCSRGQEAYSLSIFMSHHLKELAPDFTFEILASDICSESIAIAKNGVYHWDELKEIPSTYLDGFWTRGKGSVKDFAKAKSEIRNQITFDVINVKGMASAVGNRTFDLIFCRNVFIYFSSPRIKSVTLDFLQFLQPNGFFFLGMSETLLGLDLPVASCGMSIYRHKGATLLNAHPTSRPVSKNLRVLCVDDSPTVLKLLNHVLSPAEGFEVVGTAKNGLEAAEFLKTNTVDLVTLDIHMPEQNGVEYLRKNLNSDHPPVVIVSSVAREDANLAHTALQLGAMDYVEKPALDGLAQRADEIRAKLKCAYKLRRRQESPSSLELVLQKSSQLQSVDGKLRILIAGAGNISDLLAIVRNLSAPQPPLVVLFSGPANLISELLQQIREINSHCFLLKSATALQNGSIYLGLLSTDFERIRDTRPSRQTSLMVMGTLTEADIVKVKSWRDIQIIVEDLDLPGVEMYKKMRHLANEVVPTTTFIYASDRFFNRGFSLHQERAQVEIVPMTPTILKNGEIADIKCRGESLVCLYHTRSGIGGVLVVPEDILEQDSLLLEQKVSHLIMMMGSHGDHIKAKLVGSDAMLKKLTNILTERKVTTVFSRDSGHRSLDALFFPESGRLRLPKFVDSSEQVPQTNLDHKIRVLIVEDSKVERELLRRIIEGDGSMIVVGEADRPSKVASLVVQSRPDVMTLDIDLPEVSGVELLKTLMPRFTIPTVVISATNIFDGQQVIQALELGALDYIEKPKFSEIQNIGPIVREKLRIASATLVKSQNEKIKSTKIEEQPIDQSMIIAIGASTGGTAAIKEVLSGFPAQVPPILIAQHIPAVFSLAFAQRLATICKFGVKEAQNGDAILPGQAYVAPGGKQMEVIRHSDGLKIRVYDSGSSQLFSPSADILFNSIAEVAGKKSIGILLTGMGKDGAEGLLAMHKRGAHTIAQNQETCAVFGMPKAAIDLGAAEHIKSLNEIPSCVFSFLAKAPKAAA